MTASPGADRQLRHRPPAGAAARAAGLPAQPAGGAPPPRDRDRLGPPALLRLSTPVQALRPLPPGAERPDHGAESSPVAPTLARLLGIADDGTRRPRPRSVRSEPLLAVSLFALKLQVGPAGGGVWATRRI